jgi:hypothetical protein
LIEDDELCEESHFDPNFHSISNPKCFLKLFHLLTGFLLITIPKHIVIYRENRIEQLEGVVLVKGNTRFRVFPFEGYDFNSAEINRNNVIIDIKSLFQQILRDG